MNYNKLKTKIWILFLIISTLFSCSKNNENKITEYYQNGQLMISVDTIDYGVFSGVLNYYNESGTLISSQGWYNGELLGDLYFYNQDGSIKYANYYQNENLKILVGENLSYKDLFDKNLLRFYSENIILTPDSAFVGDGFEKLRKYKFDVLNLPDKITTASISYGSIYRKNGSYIFRVGSDDKVVTLKFWVALKEGNYPLFEIERKTVDIKYE